MAVSLKAEEKHNSKNIAYFKNRSETLMKTF